MPRYDKDVRSALKTALRFECEYANRVKEAASCDDKKMRGSLLFGNWMASRRIGKSHHIMECQAKDVHEMALVVNSVNFCTCALFDGAGQHIGAKNNVSG